MAEAVSIGVIVLLGTSFMLLQWKVTGPGSSEWRVHQEYVDRNPVQRAEIVRAVLGTAMLFGSLGVAFYLGYRHGGVGAAVVATTFLGVVFGLAAAAFAVWRATTQKQ